MSTSRLVDGPPAFPASVGVGGIRAMGGGAINPIWTFCSWFFRPSTCDLSPWTSLFISLLTTLLNFFTIF